LSDIASGIREALNAGLNAQALDLARGATIDVANADEIRYLGALASARMGAIDEAEKWLAQVDRETLRDRALAVEVWSLAGRIAKERYAAARDKASIAAHDLARAAIDNYRRALSLSGAAYPAVNAATMTMLAGDAPGAFALARQALATLSAPVDHWQHASAGEALLLLGELDEARAHYAEAHRLAGNKFGDVASMRRQLLMIGSIAAHELAEVLPAPQVIAFSGHMIDHPERESPRFPAGL
jgi:tetratricopeptide (TPR) repeat protein